MSQGTVLFGAILLAFLIYITVKGQIPGYLDVLGI